MKTIIIGGGAAGMMAALEVSQLGETILLEKMPRLGTKLSITGKGRCNLTNACERTVFFENIPRNPKFMRGSFSAFDNQQVMKYFETLGVSLKIERGNRVFPQSDRAEEIVAAMERELQNRGVFIRKNTKVIKLDFEEDKKKVFLEAGQILEADAVILATGGKSYPGTGSTGDGYGLLKDLGLDVIPFSSALAPLEAKDLDTKALMGLSLKNVGFSIWKKQGKRCFYEMGEMLFTHFGLSGPIVLTASSLAFEESVQRSGNLEDYVAEIDFKPALSEELLENRFQRESIEKSKKNLSNVLSDWLPQRCIVPFLEQSNLDGNKKMHEIRKEERKRFLHTMKHFTISLKSIRPIAEAIISRGGLDVKELSPKTMETKKIEGFFVCGELLDVDGLTGGFNLQIAFSTAMAAAKGVREYYASHTSN